MDNPVIKRSPGQPSKLGTINLEQMRKLYLAGWTDKQVADFFNINVDTIHEWKKKNPELKQNIKDWKVDADAKVERSLFKRANGFKAKYKKNFVVSQGKDVGSVIKSAKEEIYFAPDPLSCIFWLKNRKPDQWRDRTEHDYNVKLDLSEKLKAARLRADNLLTRKILPFKN